MRTNCVRLFAPMLFIVLVAPQAFAQDAEVMADESEKAVGHHVHHGTMTPPGDEAMDIMYEISMVDAGYAGWIVAEMDGQELKAEMMDLVLSEEMVSYYWSPPGSDAIIVCELAAVEEGGWAGECIDKEDGDVGLMSMAPMMMDHDTDQDADHDADYDDHDDHDADDGGDDSSDEEDESDG